MKSELPKGELRALPLQVIDTADGVLLKRGCTVFKVSGEGAATAVQIVLSKLATTGTTVGEIAEQFAAPDRKAVQQLLERLIANRLVVSAKAVDPPTNLKETQLDVFYWHFGESTARITERLNSLHLVILGVNAISRQLCASLIASGANNVDVIDHPNLRNINLFDAEGKLSDPKWTPLGNKRPLDFKEWMDNTDPASWDCLVATSDFGGHLLLQEWNQFCVDHNRHFFPIVLQDEVGYLGPLVVPGETACLDCLLARQDSHKLDRDSSRLIQQAGFEGQKVAGFHPAMASILGDIGALELTKFYSGALPGWNVGTLIEVNLLSTRMIPRKVLKIPRCPACSPLRTRPSSNSNKASFSTARTSGK